MISFEEKTTAVNEVFDGKIIKVHVDDVILPNGKSAKREVVEHSGGVCVAALYPDGTLPFVRQFRYPFNIDLLELPAGKREPGEDPVEGAKRELSEECGIEAESLISMGTVYPTVAYCSEVIYLYLATDFIESRSHLDEDEFLNVERIKLDDAVKMVMNGEIPDSKTQILLLKLAKMKAEGKM